MSKKKKIYWVEGVSEKEVRASLADTRFNYLRTTQARKTLVVVLVALFAVCAISNFSASLLATWVSFISAILMLFVYFALRTSIRQIADAPDALIDERQQQIRDNAYLHSYRILAGLVALMFLSALFGFHIEIFSDSQTGGLVAGTLMLIAALPSAVIAWGEKGE